MTTQTLPKEFVLRRLHSLMGLWLVLFLMEHLLVNSQAALWIGDNGRGFVEMVNSIHNFPYLEAIEIFLLGVPFAIHMIWGIQYLFTAKSNAHKTSGNAPSLPQYGRNRAYSWQRITSWILLIGIIGHVAKFRFIDYPSSLNFGEKQIFMCSISVDKGLYTVADRLGVELFSVESIRNERKAFEQRKGEQALLEVAKSIPDSNVMSAQEAMILNSAQVYRQKEAFVNHLEKFHLDSNEIVAVAKDFGTASLLTVRDTFKSPLYIGLYTIFVLAACFHAFNGFWTFLITWGIVLKMSAQKSSATFAIGLMAIVAFLGLAAVWGSYWVNLKM
jgi:succinate dehydrogenase / fumarate reductase cytochrome b subunit